MKLTESKIKEIILEEIQNIYLEENQENPESAEKPQGQGQDQQNPEEQSKIQGDVKTMLKMIPKIDTYVEYQQLLYALLKHNFGDDVRKKVILRNAQKDILKMIQEK